MPGQLFHEKMVKFPIVKRARCHSITYCCQECQRGDWPLHSSVRHDPAPGAEGKDQQNVLSTEEKSESRH